MQIAAEVVFAEKSTPYEPLSVYPKNPPFVCTAPQKNHEINTKEGRETRKTKLTDGE
jgi:hypothetical protein